jgi:hypothetical protein
MTKMGRAVRLTRPRLLGLGEAMHGDEAFPRLRTQAFQRLVEHEGYGSASGSKQTPKTAPGADQPQGK